MRFLAYTIMGGALFGLLLDALYVFRVLPAISSGSALCHLAMC